MDRFSYPIEVVSGLRDRIMQLAEEHEWIVNELMEHKLEYAESHGARCWCDPENRRCPCSLEQLADDFAMFDDTCLCYLIMTPERLEKWLQHRASYDRRKELEAQMSPEERATRKRRLNNKKKDAQNTFNRMTGKPSGIKEKVFGISNESMLSNPCLRRI